MKNKNKRPPVQPAMCATCPFRHGSKYAELAEYLTSASTREARDIQLKMFAAMGFITAATDEAWENKCAEMGL